MDNTIDDNIEDKERHELNESNINYNELSEESDNDMNNETNDDSDYDINEDSVNNSLNKHKVIQTEVKLELNSVKKFGESLKHKTKVKLIEMIDRNEVTEEIDENNSLIRVYKRLDKSGLLSNTVMGFGCNWNECHFITLFKQRVISHINTMHTKEEQYICDVCNRLCHSAVQLSSHKIHHKIHTKITFRCDWNDCQFKTTYKSGLEEHMKLHNGVKGHECHWPSCEATFVSHTDLKSHMLSHTESRLYVCDWAQCEYRTKTSTNLNTHKKTHLGLKPYSCDWTQCEAKFTQKHNLDRHKARHTGDKKYRYDCDRPECDQTFDNSKHLNQHLFVVHNIKPIACLQEGCDRRFIQISGMTSHFNTNHK